MTQKYTLEELENLAYLFCIEDYENEILKEKEDRDWSKISLSVADALKMDDDAEVIVHWESDTVPEEDLDSIKIKALKAMLK